MRATTTKLMRRSLRGCNRVGGFVFVFFILVGCSQSSVYNNYSLSAYSSFPEEMEGLISVWSKCSACLDNGICGQDTKAQCLDKTLPSRASALDHAIGRSNIQALRYLVEVAGADVNEPMGEYQETSLHIASYYGAETPRNYEVMKYLLDRGADVHARTVGGDFHWSPLRTAVWKNKIVAVKLLIQYGALTDEDSVRGACVVARSNGREAMVPLLPRCCERAWLEKEQRYSSESIRLHCEKRPELAN